jgi:hypothetical protein
MLLAPVEGYFVGRIAIPVTVIIPKRAQHFLQLRHGRRNLQLQLVQPFLIDPHGPLNGIVRAYQRISHHTVYMSVRIGQEIPPAIDAFFIEGVYIGGELFEFILQCDEQSGVVDYLVFGEQPPEHIGQVSRQHGGHPVRLRAALQYRHPLDVIAQLIRRFLEHWLILCKVVVVRHVSAVFADCNPKLHLAVSAGFPFGFRRFFFR